MYRGYIYIYNQYLNICVCIYIYTYIYEQLRLIHCYPIKVMATAAVVALLPRSSSCAVAAARQPVQWFSQTWLGVS